MGGALGRLCADRGAAGEEDQLITLRPSEQHTIDAIVGESNTKIDALKHKRDEAVKLGKEAHKSHDQEGVIRAAQRIAHIDKQITSERRDIAAAQQTAQAVEAKLQGKSSLRKKEMLKRILVANNMTPSNDEADAHADREADVDDDLRETLDESRDTLDRRIAESGLVSADDEALEPILAEIAGPGWRKSVGEDEEARLVMPAAGRQPLANPVDPSSGSGDEQEESEDEASFAAAMGVVIGA